MIYCLTFGHVICRFYRGDQDSEEELNLGSDDEYESDVPETSLGKIHSHCWNRKAILIAGQIEIGIDVSDESDSETEMKQPKKVRFADAEKDEVAKTVAAKKLAAKKVLTDDTEHPLLTDLENGDSQQKRKRKADQWFSKVLISQYFSFNQDFFLVQIHSSYLLIGLG